MIINKSIDVEEEIRTALAPYLTAYCRPLPKHYTLPNILITQVGGTATGRSILFPLSSIPGRDAKLKRSTR